MEYLELLLVTWLHSLGDSMPGGPNSSELLSPRPHDILHSLATMKPRTQNLSSSSSEHLYVATVYINLENLDFSTHLLEP